MTLSIRRARISALAGRKSVVAAEVFSKDKIFHNGYRQPCIALFRMTRTQKPEDGRT
jgi:hypothetical protein